MGTNPEPGDTWDLVAEAIRSGNFDEAARLIMKTTLLPGLRRQLQRRFDRLPPDYIDDALAEAVEETFIRLRRKGSIDPEKVGGYIFSTARYILQRVAAELKEQHELIDADQTPYDDELVGKVDGLGDITEDPATRSAAIKLLASLIPSLKSSDSAKQVLRTRFEAAMDGEWLRDSEVAEILGVPKGNVSSWWKRGLADLQEHCAEHGIDRANLEDLAVALDEVNDDDDEDDDEEGEEDGEYGDDV